MSFVLPGQIDHVLQMLNTTLQCLYVIALQRQVMLWSLTPLSHALSQNNFL